MGNRRAIGSVYKRRRPDGTKEDVWSISFRPPGGGRRITERAYSDKGASEALLAQRLREAARDDAGIGDPFRKHRGKPLTAHLDDFLGGLASRNVSPRYRKLVRARLLRAFDAMKATVIGDLDLATADKFLGDLIDAGNQSVKTRDHYAMALRQFGLWLLDSDRCARNVFHRLRGVATPADTTRERLALTSEQVQLLAAAASERPVFEYRKTHPQAFPETLEKMARNGRRRGLLYLFSALTGLRRAECAGIRWADVELGPGPSVTARPSTTKSKRRDPLPLDAKLAAMLLDHRKERAAERGGRVPPPTEAVFAVPKNLPEQLRKDAKFAGIPLEDEHGRKLDFHALRATLATLLARAGVPMQIHRRLMRHTDPAITAQHYEKLALSDLRAGSDLLAVEFWRDPSVAKTSAKDERTEAQTDAPRREASGGGRSGTP